MYLHGQEGMSQCRHFADKGVNFLRICTDVFHEQPRSDVNSGGLFTKSENIVFIVPVLILQFNWLTVHSQHKPVSILTHLLQFYEHHAKLHTI